MLVLSLDTSADIAVSLVRVTADLPGGAPTPAVEVLAARRVAEQRRHAELLAPMVAEVLAEGGADRRALEAVVVGTGPAPFTGLRAGLVTARTLGFALGLPVHGVCSLDAIAAQAFDAGVVGRDDEVLVATDARRREVYVARYRAAGAPGDVEVLAGPAVLAPADARGGTGTGPDVVVVGHGAALYPEPLGAGGTAAGGGTPALEGPDPAVLARLAVARAAAGVELPTEPLYLRRPDVVPSAGRKRATG